MTFTGASQGQTVGPRPLSCYYRRAQVINRLVLRATELLEPPTRQSRVIKELHRSMGELSIGVPGTSRRLQELQMWLYKLVVCTRIEPPRLRPHPNSSLVHLSFRCFFQLCCQCHVLQAADSDFVDLRNSTCTCLTYRLLHMYCTPRHSLSRA